MCYAFVAGPQQECATGPVASMNPVCYTRDATRLLMQLDVLADVPPLLRDGDDITNSIAPLRINPACYTTDANKLLVQLDVLRFVAG